MAGSYLEVTFRNGLPIAGYFYLPRQSGDRSIRVENQGPGLIVDFADSNRPIGIEITIPHLATVNDVNRILQSYGYDPVTIDDLAPLHAAA